MERTKVCSSCGVDKPVSEFHTRRNRAVGIQSKCKPCQRAAVKRAYDDGVQRERRTFMLALKAGPCMDCGVAWPAAAMDFHHRDPKTKSFQVAAAHKHTEAEILAEIAKCDLVCACCHRIRHQRWRDERKTRSTRP